MTVHVVTDSSSCLPKELAQQAGVTVIDLHTSGKGAERSTAGLGALELTAVYARLLERGHDDGVVAIHISKELSATWNNAVTASGIFDHTVRVLDTNSAGMGNGFAALKAAEVAQAGGTLEEVTKAAQDMIAQSKMWLYLHRLDMMRRGGRLSPGQTLLSTALAIKPILSLSEGRVVLAAKTRTLNKAMDKLVSMVAREVADEALLAVREERKPRRVCVAIQQAEAVESAEKLIDAMNKRLETLEEEARTHTGHFATEDSEKKRDITVPSVEFSMLEIAEVLRVHTGPGAIAVSTSLW